LDGQGVGVPELSVIRVFAGKNLQTEATFKTVLLNSLTTSSDLVRQAIQRFRLPSGENESDYYLTVKQVEGSSAVLLPSEHPLRVFEMLVEAAMELPKVKRSSVGSISSVSSNLSMHPAIKKLSMNDFTDDSAVKFYLNRRSDDGVEDSVMGHDDDKTIVADHSLSDSERSQYLTVSTPSDNVTPERFNSPSFRFALQLVIYPDDLPDDMVFDPMTEAIVFKHTLRDRPTNPNPSSSTGISQNMRRKVFVFPKNVTVAEVIELGLERFGILEGVVDGGDEVEDKFTKRRSMARVRYGLTIDIGSHGQSRPGPFSCS
jgi:Ras association (RalGDS/AF-6) domain